MIIRDGRWWLALDTDGFAAVEEHRSRSGARPLEIMGKARTFAEAHRIIVLFQQELRENKHRSAKHANVREVDGYKVCRNIEANVETRANRSETSARIQTVVSGMAG